MSKIIIRFLNFVLELSAVLIVIGGGLSVVFYKGYYSVPDIMLFFPIGAIAGFIIATIILGIPLLLLRINQNLEEINESLNGKEL